MIPYPLQYRLKRLAFYIRLLAFGVVSAQAKEEIGKPQELVNKAQITFQHFVSDPDMGWFRNHLKDSKAILIIPQLLKGGFIFGASGGSGALLSRDGKTGKWNGPAFYTKGNATFGLQIGGEVSEVVLMIRTEKGMDALLTSSFKLGGEANVAAGPVGAGAKAATGDILAFARSQKIFGGLTIHEQSGLGLRIQQ
ncbi:MAG: lipid-binding SYLF domain-containing protein [Deltaproteobacteria bacterium]|nr:MAG: lipid-binding SYLF domain-containing protein [Deltaproteobacteria bacterium]